MEMENLANSELDRLTTSKTIKYLRNTSLNNQQKIKEILECFKEVTGQVFDKDKMGNKID